MPTMVVCEIPTYLDDLGNSYSNLRFKIRADKQGVSGFDVAVGNNVCGGGGSLFQFRAVVAQYPDGSTIRYPVSVPASAGVRSISDAAIADGAICTHLDGEKWSFIPPSLVGGSPNRSSFVVPTGFADKEVGEADYTSDVFAGSVAIRYAIELRPTAIADAVRGCLANPVPGESLGCTTGSQITARYLQVEARNSAGGAIVRKTKPQNVGDDVGLCAAALYAVGHCVRYKGESARNVNLLLP